MLHLIPQTNLDFVGARWKFFIFSTALMAAGAVSLATRGIRYGIDFTGGTLIQISFQRPITLAELRKAADAGGLGDVALQSFAGTNTFSLRIQSDPNSSAEKLEQYLKTLQTAVPNDHFIVDRKEYVGPVVGKHLFRQALWAVVLSLLGMIIYLAFRFDNPIWGFSGVIALAHDVFLTYALFSVLGLEVDLLIVTALLTIAGYSIHDTIVVFDRMREKMRLLRNAPLHGLINDSMNETLSRTIITSMLVFVVVLILFIFGGKVIHNFALAMVFGVGFGTYSSVAIAAPLVYEWQVRHSRQRSSGAPAASPSAQGAPGVQGAQFRPKHQGRNR